MTQGNQCSKTGMIARSGGAMPDRALPCGNARRSIRGL
jgi:hypothetical protein